MSTTTTPTPRVVRDSAGKKASVRKVAAEGSEHVATEEGWDFYVEPKTGKYFVVAAAAAEVADPSTSTDVIVAEVRPGTTDRGAKRWEVWVNDVFAAAYSTRKRASEVVAEGSWPTANLDTTPTPTTDVPVEAVTKVAKVESPELVQARADLEVAARALDELVRAAANARAARAEAMVAMKAAGASYAQVAEVVGMTPMSARAAVLGAQA